LPSVCKRAQKTPQNTKNTTLYTTRIQNCRTIHIDTDTMHIYGTVVLETQTPARANFQFPEIASGVSYAVSYEDACRYRLI
jgi:hypothetical protein